MPHVAVTAAYRAQAERSRQGFDRFAALTVVGGLITLGIALAFGDRVQPGVGAAFWVFAALCVVGELLPIRLGRIAHCDQVTMSSAFACAILLGYGALPAMVVYALASLLADTRDRLGVRKTSFNAAQYVLALGAAAAVLALLGYRPDLGYATGELPAYLLALAAFFLANHVLAGTAAALLTAQPVPAYLAADPGFYLWTAGLQLALAPIALMAAGTQLILVPLLALPLLGIYLAGRHAVLNAHLAYGRDGNDSREGSLR